jgi:lipopolysaccharide transport system ATP-binding protein
MARPAIIVEGVGKAYPLLTAGHRSTTLREALARRIERTLRPGAKPAAAGAAPEFWALRDVSFEVRHGEVLGIVGPNGAGKSTLLKILARVVEPTRGRITVDGRLGALLEVGTGFHGELTGRENIYLNGAMLGMSRKEIASKLEEIVEFSGVERFIDQPVKHYSSGMYMRLAFSVAAHVEPDILVMDEVLAVGDVAFQQKCLTKTEALAASGRTVLLVSHQLAYVRRLSTRVIVIENGTLSADGSATRELSAYISRYDIAPGQEISSATPRSGRGTVRLTRIEIRAPAGPPTTGHEASFIFHTRGEKHPVTCAFAVFDDLGEPVYYADAAERSPGDRLGPEIRCDFPALLLRPGRYRIDAVLTSLDGVIEDEIPGCVSFEVVGDTLDGRPVAGAPGYGSVAIPHRWTLTGA